MRNKRWGIWGRGSTEREWGDREVISLCLLLERLLVIQTGPVRSLLLCFHGKICRAERHRNHRKCTAHWRKHMHVVVQPPPISRTLGVCKTESPAHGT